ncbi:plexin domain-containing protein 2-like isoform X2 [Littorina saxatilis]|uniref:plexin domain-containing protein 2-like isoform X2 n=1 Tax=Littorina saxatilis TaxID=31220 RepID=UPI0038B60F02
MAKNGCVCYSTACVVILALILPSSDSTNSRDVGVEYSVAGINRDYRTEVKSLSDAHLWRVRRQAPGEANGTSSENGSAPTPAGVTMPPVDPTTTARPPATTRAPATTQRPPATTTPTPTTIRPPQTPAPQTPAPTPTTMRPPQTPAPQTPAPQTPEPQTQRPGGTTESPIIVKDNHNYYTSAIFPGYADQYFIELDNPSSQGTLNSGHRLAVTIALPFKFRFYGHNITNITVATGGFIYMSPFLHQWLTATQYIAPLMANFETSASTDSNIFYKQVGEEFIIEWHNVFLKDQTTGVFVFQTKLKSDGTITFVYKSLPIPVSNISSSNHPVKIGLSDAFYNDTFLPEYGIKRRTIIEYHRVPILKEQVEEGTVIVLSPLPTCNVITDCGTCAQHSNVKFDCKWCNRVSRCSDGLDWYRQDWEKKGCKSSEIADVSQCYLSTTLPMQQSTNTPSQIPQTTPNGKSANASASKDNCVGVADISQCNATTTANTSTNTPTQSPQNPTTTVNTSTNPPTPATQNPTTTKPKTTQPPRPALTSSQAHTPTTTSVPKQVPTTHSTHPHPPKPTTEPTESSQTTPNAKSVNASASKDACRNSNDGSCDSGSKNGSVAAIIAVVLILVVLFGSAAIWVFYAYTHPTSPSGMWLMEHRPSQMKAKLASMKFWKKSTPAGTKYACETEA